jgi:hypothetical protein
LLVAVAACGTYSEKHDAREGDAAADEETDEVDLSQGEGAPEGLGVLGYDGGFGNAIGTQYANLLGDQDIEVAGNTGFRVFRFSGGDVRNFNYAHADALINKMWSKGVTPHVIISTPIGDMAGHPERWDSVGAAAATVASHYRQGRVIWEMWNEPNNTPYWGGPQDPALWAQLAVRMAASIHSVAPNHVTLGPAVSTGQARGLKFLDAALKTRRDLGQHLDSISIHGYVSTGREPPESLASTVQKTRQVLKKYGIGLPIYVSEWGWSEAQVPAGTHGAYSAQLGLMTYVLGLSGTIIYQLRDESPNPQDRYGLFTQDWQPRPAYSTVKQMFDELRGYVAIRQIRGTGTHAILFQGPGGALKIAAWSTTNRNVSLSVKGAGKNKMTIKSVGMWPKYVGVAPGFF